jgi:hypothetical protein
MRQPGGCLFSLFKKKELLKSSPVGRLVFFWQDEPVINLSASSEHHFSFLPRVISHFFIIFVISLSAYAQSPKKAQAPTQAPAVDSPAVVPSEVKSPAESVPGPQDVTPAPVPSAPVAPQPVALPSAAPTTPTSLAPKKNYASIRIPFREPFAIGHLLSPSISTLKEGQFTLGTTVAGVGLSDDVMVVTSPWLVGYYNLANLVVRIKVPANEPSWAVQGGYFKSQQALGKTYKMEALGAWILKRVKLSSIYKIVYSFNYFHYMNAEVPWSLWRRSFSANEANEKGIFTFTTLHEISTNSPINVNVEAGVLGLTFHYPNYHFGASVGYNWPTGFMKFGFSATGYFANITKSAYNQVYSQYKDSPGATIDFNSAYLNSVGIHPELQLQFLF